MTPIPWPAVNTDVLRESYTEDFQDSVHRFSPDVGPSIDTSRTIVAGTLIGFQQWFTHAEYATIEAWRRVTLKNGVLLFTRTHPTKGVNTIFKFNENGFRLVELMPLERRVMFSLYEYGVA